MNHFTMMCLTAALFTLFSGHNSWCDEYNARTPLGSVSFGTEFSSGDYNTGNTTRSIYLPLVITLLPSERFDVSVELPLVYQSSSAVTTSLFQTTAASTSSQTVARRGGPGGMTTTTGTSTGTTGTVSGSTSDSTSVYGLGDIVGRIGYIPLFEDTYLPQVRTSAFVKTPTAPASKGLGTGEFDYGGGLDIFKWFGNIQLAGEAIYTFQGKVAGFGLKNYISYSGTVGYQVTDSIRPMLALKGATAPSLYSDDLLEVRGRLLLALDAMTNLDLFVSRGISGSSPDYGGGVAIIYSF